MRKTQVHVVIPDTQAKPGVPTDHLRWIGQYIVDEFRDLPIKIIHLGDHADMPSLSSYDKGKKSMQALDVGILPTSILIDPAGRELGRIEGAQVRLRHREIGGSKTA